MSRDVVLPTTVLAEATEPILLVAGECCCGDPPVIVDVGMRVLVQWLCCAEVSGPRWTVAGTQTGHPATQLRVATLLGP